MRRKIVFCILITLLTLLILGVCSIASNEGLSILKGYDDEYLIYVRNHEDTVFEFAYANSQSVDKNTLRYRAYASDTLGNKIAYINASVLADGVFDTSPTYIWVRTIAGKEYIINGVEINLTKVLDIETLEEVSDITRRIPVNVEGSVVTEEIIDGKKVSITQGKMVLEDNTKEYEYQIIRIKNDPSYDNLIDLARRIAKFDDSTDNATKIAIYTAFYEELEKLQPSVTDTKWARADNNEIIQPEDTEDGEVYLVWLKDVETGVIDMQIMTAVKQYEEEKIRELPVTGEDYMLWIVSGIAMTGMAINVAFARRNKISLCYIEKK